MTLPEVVTEHLDGEKPVAEVDLGGEDRLYVTPTRTLIYRAEGLLSDETVDEYPHDAERIVVKESRRKAKVTMDYGLDGEDAFTLPKDKLDAALHPVLAGVLNAADITDPGETVKRTFRFSELTLVVTSDRVVKHIGQAVWDEDYEEHHFDDVTDLAFEEGNVATSVVLTVNGRQERFKAPNDDARAVEEAITNALLAHYDVADLGAFRALSADEEGEEGAEAEANDPFGGGLDPLSAGSDDTDADPLADDVDVVETDVGGNSMVNRAVEQVTDDEFEPATESVQPVDDTDDELRALAGEVSDLRETVEKQRQEMERQSELIETLIEELRQGR